jgi:hypothetical protein
VILVIDDEPDIEFLFRQNFRRDLRAGRFGMDFARSAAQALEACCRDWRPAVRSHFFGHQYAWDERPRYAAAYARAPA